MHHVTINQKNQKKGRQKEGNLPPRKLSENLLLFCADVSNAFAEAPPPKQGFNIQPDKAFNDWWVHHKKRMPIPTGHVIPVLSAMQGHPESP
jgi:hypothetical protein